MPAFANSLHPVDNPLEVLHLHTTTVFWESNTITQLSNGCCYKFPFWKRSFPEGFILRFAFRKNTRMLRHRFTTWPKNSTIFTKIKLNRWRHWHDCDYSGFPSYVAKLEMLAIWLKYCYLFGAKLRFGIFQNDRFKYVIYVLSFHKRFDRYKLVS